MKKTLNKLLSAVLALTLVMSFSTTAFAATFTDVPEKHWSYNAVEKAVANNLVAGMGNGKYAPDKSVTNAEWSQMIANLLWDDVHTVPGNPWWFDAMRFNYEARWFNGTTLGNSVDTKKVQPFNEKVVNAVINRYDMAQIIYNISIGEFDLTVDTTDISNDISDYRNIPTKYRTAVEYCYSAGFIVGVDATGTFDGEGDMTRGAAATVLTRLFDCVNGNWVVPERNIKTETPSMNTVVKDMITVKSTERRNFDYEITVNNTTSKGMLSNGKDITAKNIAAMLAELKVIFPAGTAWGDYGSGACYYYSANAPAPNGGGCNAWAGMTGDMLFGRSAKWTSHSNLENAKPGDLIEFKDKNGVAKHWVVVLTAEKTTIEQYINGKFVDVKTVMLTVCDGNSGGKVQWGTNYAVADILSEYPNSTLYSAY